VLASSVVDRGFEPRSGSNQTLKIVIVASLLKTEHYAVKAKTGNWLRIKIMCPR